MKTDNPVSAFDKLKWLVLILLIVGGLVANYHYSAVPGAIRLVGWIVLLIVWVAIVFQTRRGAQLLKFMRAARNELRKVVWPTRQETIQTTFIVIVMVVIMALILWGVDSFLLWAVSWLTGQRG